MSSSLSVPFFLLSFSLCLLYSLCDAPSYCLLTVTTTTNGAPTTTTDLQMTDFKTPPIAVPINLQILKSVSLTSTSTDFTVRASLAATIYWVLFRKNAQPEPRITIEQVRRKKGKGDI